MYSALLGNPVEHSISDELFEYLNHNIGVLDEYKHKKILVDSVCLEDKIKHLINDPKCIGLNITLPYKREVMRYIDNLDRVAEITGSVNNIYKSGNIITGTNTDWKGIYNTLVFFNISHITKCCVLGTGGTARAAIFTLQKLQISPTVVYREPISENTRSLIKSFPDLKYITYKELADQQILNDMEIIINTTPVGMINYEESLPINFDHLDNVNYKDKYFMDVVFNPLHTKLHTPCQIIMQLNIGSKLYRPTHLFIQTEESVDQERVLEIVNRHLNNGKQNTNLILSTQHFIPKTNVYDG